MGKCVTETNGGKNVKKNKKINFHHFIYYHLYYFIHFNLSFRNSVIVIQTPTPDQTQE